jgi:hypothetical protein
MNPKHYTTKIDPIENNAYMNVSVTLKTSLNQDCKKSLQQTPTLNNNIVQVQNWNIIQLEYNLYTYVPSTIMTQRTWKI